MSTKSKRRHARRHASSLPGSRHQNDEDLSPKDRRIAGELMGAILAAFSFGALAYEQ